MLGARQSATESPSWACFRAADPLKVPIDPNGNLSSKTEGTDTWTYTWNAENQLTKVEKNGVEVARFAYDPLGRRVEKVAGAVTTSYTYDADDILREMRGTTPLKYVHGPALDELLAADDGTTLTHVHADVLGSIEKVTNTGGSAVLTRQYDAWGNLQAGASEPGYSFTGREWDPETGLYYYRARYYDSRVGRFISEDPLGFVADVNFYGYVGGQPTGQRDPFGLDPTTDNPNVRKCFCQLWKRGGNGFFQTEAGMDIVKTDGVFSCRFWPFTNQTRRQDRPGDWPLTNVVAIGHTHPRRDAVQHPSNPGDYKRTVDDYVVCANGVFKAGKGCTDEKDKTQCTSQPGGPKWQKEWCE